MSFYQILLCLALFSYMKFIIQWTLNLEIRLLSRLGSNSSVWSMKCQGSFVIPFERSLELPKNKMKQDNIIKLNSHLVHYCGRQLPVNNTPLWKPVEVDQHFSSVQFSSFAQSCLTLCDPMNRSTSGLPLHHQLPEFTQTHVHRVRDAIQPSHPRSPPSLPAHNPSQHQSLFQWVNSSHEVAKVLEFQL